MVAVTFIGATAQVSSLHTHSYTEHAHPEHHHGPAAHEHPQTAAHQDDDDDAAHLESCDPGEHVVSVRTTCPPLRHVGAFDVPSSNVRLVDPLVLLRSAHTVTDVRVHGPPL